MTDFSARECSLPDIEMWRAAYRATMNCQIIHESIHYRRGWTREYMLFAGDVPAGYGSLAIRGPWSDDPMIYEFFVVAEYQLHVFDLFRALMAATNGPSIGVQTNDPLITVMLQLFARDIVSNYVLFEDRVRTDLIVEGATFRRGVASEFPDDHTDALPWRGVVEIDGEIAGRGGILFHYNRPYGDIYMDVDERFRRRGIGSFLVQELKRVAYEGGHIPGARSHPTNVASHRTLQRAGFVPCGHLLKGTIRSS